jgi:hypothetical protein
VRFTLPTPVVTLLVATVHPAVDEAIVNAPTPCPPLEVRAIAVPAVPDNEAGTIETGLCVAALNVTETAGEVIAEYIPPAA